MKTNLFTLAILLILAAVTPALADDSSAALSAGSIVFTKNTPIRMIAEDLYISPKVVRIRFVFQNPTEKDIKTIVAFPLPDIDMRLFYVSPLGTVIGVPKNFVGFKAVVDGKSVDLNVEQRAIIKNKDVTKQLIAMEVPLNPLMVEKFYELPQSKKKELIDAGLADTFGSDDGDLAPNWTLRTKFFWEQVFPAKKLVVIEHSYQPVTGEFFFDMINRKRTDEEGDNGINYCFDVNTWVKLKANDEKATKLQVQVNAYKTDYILKTATNWRGPIGHFHLTLDKLKPENILSLCWNGKLNKTSETTYDFSQNNFTPSQDIHLLVVEAAHKWFDDSGISRWMNMISVRLLGWY